MDNRSAGPLPNVVLVCTGWREMHKLPYGKAAVREWFDYVESHHGHIVLVIEGGQRGADTFCRKEANRRGIPVQTVKANWKQLGPKAGPIRNRKMVAMGKTTEAAGEKVIGLAFLAPQSVGTVDMIDCMKKEGWWVEKVHLPNTEAVA